MPADIKTHPSNRPTSLQGSVFTFQSDTDRYEAIDKAFDYRGDVTLTLKSGDRIEALFRAAFAARQIHDQRASLESGNTSG